MQSENNIDNTSVKNKIKVIVAIIVIILIAIIAIIASSIFKKNEPVDDIYKEKTDAASGETLLTIQSEPEEGITDPVMIGFVFLYEFGFSATQQELVYDTIHDYFHDEYPEAVMVSYLKGSFEYNPDNFYQSTFKVVVDSEDEFTVNLDTMGTLDEIDIKISS